MEEDSGEEEAAHSCHTSILRSGDSKTAAGRLARPPRKSQYKSVRTTSPEHLPLSSMENGQQPQVVSSTPQVVSSTPQVVSSTHNSPRASPSILTARKSKVVSFASGSDLSERFDVTPERRKSLAKIHSQQDNNSKANHTLCCLYWILVLLILCLISFSIWLSARLTYNHNQAMAGHRSDHRTTFTFEDIYNSSFKPIDIHATWRAGDVLVYRSRDGDLIAYDAAHNKTTIILPNTIFDEVKSEEFTLSPDMDFVLFAFEIKQYWSQSFTARYNIFDRTSTDTDKQFLDFPSDVRFRDVGLQHAAWSTTGNSLSFVFENNLYFQASPTGVVQQLTTSGVPHVIFNGVTDWLYETEILQSSAAHWWSPDSQHLCYVTFNDTLVPSDSLQQFDPAQPFYSSSVQLRTPKAGDSRSGKIPQVSLYVVDITEENHTHVLLQPHTHVMNIEHYIFHVQWKSSTHVTVSWSNRFQNESITSHCDIRDGRCIKVFHQTMPSGWIEPPQDSIYITDDEYLTLLPKEESGGLWQHVALVTTSGGRGAVTFITQGLHEVTKLVAYDHSQRHVYYMSTNGDSKKNHLFRVGRAVPYQTGGRSSSTVPDMTEAVTDSYQCLTCELDDNEADCGWSEAQLSSSGQYYLLACMGPAPPTYSVMQTSTNKRHAMLEDNDLLVRSMNEKVIPRLRFTTADTGNGIATVRVVVPPNVDEDSTDTKRPMLIHLATRPGERIATEKFRMDWATYLASSLGIIYVWLDVAGASGRGMKYRHQNHRGLGTLDGVEIAEAVKNLSRQLRYTDSHRVAIWGLGAGGFLASHALASTHDVIHCALGVSSFYDLRYQAAAFSERYMGLDSEDDNRRGYDDSKVGSKIEHLLKKKMLIMHSLQDDVVPISNILPLLRNFGETEMNYKLQILPDMSHRDLVGSGLLYFTLKEYLMKQCWGVPPEDRYIKLETYIKRERAIGLP